VDHLHHASDENNMDTDHTMLSITLTGLWLGTLLLDLGMIVYMTLQLLYLRLRGCEKATESLEADGQGPLILGIQKSTPERFR
jgi:hypothetical protein